MVYPCMSVWLFGVGVGREKGSGMGETVLYILWLRGRSLPIILYPIEIN
jgi:hypothetical protein